MSADMLVCIAIWGLSSLVFGVTGAAKAIARRLGNPEGWQCLVAGGLLGLVILVAASYPWSDDTNAPAVSEMELAGRRLDI